MNTCFAPTGFATSVRRILSLFIGLALACAHADQPRFFFSTLAGTAGQSGDADGAGTSARFNDLADIAVDASGSVYVADGGSHTIRKITADGVVTTLAGLAGQMGSSDGIGSAARFRSPRGLAVDGAGNVFVADTGNSTIRKIAPDGTVTTVAGTAAPGSGGGYADGTGPAAGFKFPEDVAVDATGTLFVADTGNNTIRQISPAGVVTTLAGNASERGGNVDGVGAAARFDSPHCITIGGNGALYVTDYLDHRVCRVTADGTVTTELTDAAYTLTLAIDGDGNWFGAFAHEIAKRVAGISYSFPAMGEAGSADGPENAVRFNSPRAIAVNAAGDLYVADRGNYTVRKGVRMKVTWPQPAAVPVGTALTSAQLNATANVPGTLAYSPALGELVTSGPQSLYVTFTPTGGNNLTTISASVVLTGTGGTPQVTWNRPATIQSGTALGPAQLNATANVPGTFTYDPAAGTVLPVGEHRLRVTFVPADTGTYATTTAETLILVEGSNPSIPVITQPVSQSIAVGGSTTFSFKVNSSTPVTYSWFFSRDGGITWQFVADDGVHSGAHSETLTITSASIDMNGTMYRGYASKPGAWQWGEPARLSVVGAVAYVGGYFGTFVHGGTWALHVGSPSRFIAYLPARKTALVQTVTVNNDGTFTAECPAYTVPASGAAKLTLSARITAPSQSQRPVAGQLVELGEPLSGSFTTTGGLTNFSGDFFSADALGTVNGLLSLIVGYSGEFQAVITTDSVVDGAHGVLDASGTKTVTTDNGGELSLVIDAGGRSVKATLKPAGRAEVQRSALRTGAAKALNVPESIQFAGVGQSVPARTQCVNISARAFCGDGNAVTIGGFVVAGSETKKVLIRAVGPSLAEQGLSAAEVLSDPTIEVHDAKHGNVVIARNDNWGDNEQPAEITRLGTQLGATALTGTDRASSALILDLSPGIYTFVVNGKAGASGIVLLEVYDASMDRTGSRFVNIATRAYAGSRNAVAIGGFVISGNRPKHVLLRAVGPTLSTLGLSASEVLADPTIELHDGSHGNAVIATNDNWAGDGAADRILATASRVGATPLAGTDQTSAAMLLTLSPGAYSFIATSRENRPGVVMVEVYDAD